MLVIGFLTITMVLWNRFIRKRFPKEIPFELTPLRLLLLVFLCLSLFIALIMLIKVKLIKKVVITDSFFTSLSTYIIASIQEFDHKFKQYFFSKKQLEKAHLSLLNMLYKIRYFLKTFYIISNLTKIILPLILLIEVFLLNYISLWYQLFILLLIPMIYSYLFHTLQVYYVLKIETIENMFDFRAKTDEETDFQQIISGGAHFYIQEYTLDRLLIQEMSYMFAIRPSVEYFQQFLDLDTDKMLDDCTENLTGVYSQIFELIYKQTMLRQKYLRVQMDMQFELSHVFKPYSSLFYMI